MFNSIDADYGSIYGRLNNRQHPIESIIPPTTDGKVSQSNSMVGFLSEWIRFKEHNLRPKTSQDYNRILGKYIFPYFKELHLSDLNTHLINQFYCSLVEGKTGFRTIRYIHSILRVALKDAMFQGLISSNPTTGAILPRWNKQEMHALEEKEVQRFLVAAIDSRFYYFYYLAIVTGMRLGELIGLKWIDIDFHSQVITVRRQAQAIRGRGIIFSEPKTRSGVRKIKVQAHTMDALLEQQKRIRNLRLIAGNKWMENDLVFPSNVGSALITNHLRIDFRKRLSMAGLPRIRIHDLRHTAATLLINHNVPIIVISKMLGHSKPSVTLDFYGHCSVAMQDEASRIMDGIINKP